MANEPTPTPTDPTPQPASQPTPQPVAAASDPNPAPEPPQRPEWAKAPAFDSYWNDEKGFDGARFATELTDLQTAKAEADSRAARVPEKLEDYAIGLPDDFKLPDGVTFEVNENDPMVAPAREFAKAMGLTPDQFKGLVALNVQRQIAEDAKLAERITEEQTKLGPKAPQRIDAIEQFFRAQIGGTKAAALVGTKEQPVLWTAAQVEALESVMDKMKQRGPAFSGAGREGGKGPGEISEEAWAGLSGTGKIEAARKAAQANGQQRS